MKILLAIDDSKYAEAAIQQVIAQAGEMVLLRPRKRHDYGAESTTGQFQQSGERNNTPS
jgi:hypothetical protein